MKKFAYVSTPVVKFSYDLFYYICFSSISFAIHLGLVVSFELMSPLIGIRLDVVVLYAVAAIEELYRVDLNISTSDVLVSLT